MQFNSIQYHRIKCYIVDINTSLIFNNTSTSQIYSFQWDITDTQEQSSSLFLMYSFDLSQEDQI